MIKNDRQYRITKAQIRTFEESLRDLADPKLTKGMDSTLLQAQTAAIESQREEMESDVREYDALRKGAHVDLTIESIDDIPSVLIRARIAAGLTQKDLAALLSVKEQQVQRWESNDYAGATIPTLKSVMTALGVTTTKDLFVASPRLTVKTFFNNLGSLGVQRDFMLRRLLPASIAGVFEDPQAPKVGAPDILRAAAFLSRILGVTVGDLVALQPPAVSFPALAAVRFKVPATAKATTVSAFTVYAHYLAGLVESCLPRGRGGRLSKNIHVLHRQLTGPGNPVTFRKAVGLLWDSGVVVLPLRDAGGFHGAVWKIRDHFVVVLKQSTPLESRWLFDLLHESGHIVHGHVAADASLLEEEPISPEVHGQQEESASEWAEDVLFDGKSAEIEEACVKASAGRLQKLKGVMPDIARSYNVHLGALANHMAYRLAMQKQDWWGAAHNLQSEGPDPFTIAREELLRRVDLRQLNWIDRDILMRALTED